MISVCDYYLYRVPVSLWRRVDYTDSYMAQMDHACFGGPEPFNCMSGDGGAKLLVL